LLQYYREYLSCLLQILTDTSVPAVTEWLTWSPGLTSYPFASEPKLTNPEDFQAAISGLKISKVPDPNGIPNRVLKHLPQRAVSVLVLIFNAFLLTDHFPTVWKHARVISIHKPGRIQHCPHPISPLVFSTRLVKYLKISF